MRLIIPTFLAILLIAGLAANERNQRDAAEVELKSARADAADLARQLDEADKATAEKAAAAANLATAVCKSTTEVDALKKQLGEAKRERDAALVDVNQLRESLATAKRDAANAMKAAKDSCPPPEVVPKETQAQEFAPAIERTDGLKYWRTDYDWADAKAKEMGRLQFVCWGTRSCPHCDYFLTQCSEQEVGKEIFTAYVPCWITVQDEKTHDLAEQFGINKFRYPAAMLRNTVTGKTTIWRPSKDTATFREELKQHAEAMK